MKSVFLFPYALLPVDSGAKVEAWKTLNILQSLGACTVFSAATKPVGAGWSLDVREKMTRRGFKLIMREEIQKRKNLPQLIGILYAILCKISGCERAFGHGNPYHRYAFPPWIWYSLTRHYDLAVINYSYWARLPAACPQVTILHDLLSDTMRSGSKRETTDLQTADLVVVISCEEEKKLHQRGIRNTLWSPPAVERLDTVLTEKIGVIGSANRFNIEGLQWLSSGMSFSYPTVRVFGDVGQFAKQDYFKLRGHYEQAMDPYRECGIILIPTAQGTGVQIKAVEALAAGRALVVRRGALRGIPYSAEAWLEVDSPDEMFAAASRLADNVHERECLGKAAHAYYEKYLNAAIIKQRLTSALQRVTILIDNKKDSIAKNS